MPLTNMLKYNQNVVGISCQKLSNEKQFRIPTNNENRSYEARNRNNIFILRSKTE